MNIQTILWKYRDTDFTTPIQEYLNSLQPVQQLDLILEFLDDIHITEELHSVSITYLWNLLKSQRLWERRYTTWENFIASGNYDQIINPWIAKADDIQTRKQSELRKISEQWNGDVNELLPEDIRPGRLSGPLVNALKRLSQLVTLNDALNLLRQEINDRIARARTQKVTYIIPIDIRNIVKRLSIDSSQQSQSPQPEPDYPLVIVTPQVIPNQPINPDRTDTPQTEAFSLTHSNSVSSNLSAEQSSRQPDRTESEELDSVPSKRVRKCKCPTAIFDITSQVSDQGPDRQAKLKLFTQVIELDVEKLCWHHLRPAVSHTVGLKTNGLKQPELISRAKFVYDNIHRLNDMLSDPTESLLFKESYRDPSTLNLHAPYRFPHINEPTNPIISDEKAKQIFLRLRSEEEWNEWQTNGTIILPGLLDFLGDDPRIIKIIDDEFEMYEYHHAIAERPTKGFLRNMFYSLIQQISRQSIEWYVIQVCCRPDHNPNLICYPYIGKSPKPGESTGFLHMDINLDKFHGPNKECYSQLTSSLSLNDEKPDGCTLVVPGFHKHSLEWHTKRIERSNNAPNGTTTDALKGYLPEDRATYGAPVPTPCPRFGVRVTLPNIIHGSTNKGNEQRRVLYSWHTGIQPNQVELEREGQLDRNELATCHRELKAPTRGVGGDLVSFDRPQYRFPAAVLMQSSGPISDMLIGQRPPDDPFVIRDQHILFGDDEDAFNTLLMDTRTKLVNNFLEAWPLVESMERSRFGVNSFFYQRDLNMSTDS